MDVLNAHLPRLLDLASNFNIDLSGVLAGYAQKLKNDVPEMDNFNFPEAALLLQHCSEIYGRKVDYVYNLVVELCENMNVRMYGPLGSTHDISDSVAVARKTRRRKTVTQISTEDFKKHSFSLDKSITIKKYKKNKKHCRESMWQLSAINLVTTNEFHIYDDDFASIGSKDKFRLTWSIEQNCRLEEQHNDEGGGNVWDVMDVGVSNMPTPEYSDDGIHEASEAMPETSSVRETDVDINHHQSCNAINTRVQETDSKLGSKYTPVNCDPPNAVVKPPLKKTVPFKLPYELTKKGQQEEKNITLFLFSNLLKRELRIKGTLPPLTRERNGDKKLIVKHVQFLMKRFSLEKNREALNVRSLTESQEDFLGFEEVNLLEVPEVLTPNYEGDDIDDDAAVSENFHNDEPVSFQDVPEVIGYSTKRKSTVDSEGVANWRHFIQEKLDAEENQKKFDVHDYGTNIIGAFGHMGQTLSFRQIVSGINDTREISRYFVSSLMLANTSNLILQDNGPNTLTMTLNHTERCHEMEHILVPPSAGGISPAVGHSKRKANRDNDRDDEAVTPKRSLKQIPGKGPWRNKSKKGRDK